MLLIALAALNLFLGFMQLHLGYKTTAALSFSVALFCALVVLVL